MPKKTCVLHEEIGSGYCLFSLEDNKTRGFDAQKSKVSIRALRVFVCFKFLYNPTKSLILIENRCTFVRKINNCFWNVYEKLITGVHTEHIFLNREAVVRRCCVKKVFLEISQISQENTWARVSFLIKLQAKLRLQLHQEKKIWCKCFPVNFAKFLRTPPLQSTSRRLLLALLKVSECFRTEQMRVIPYVISFIEITSYVAFL